MKRFLTFLCGTVLLAASGCGQASKPANQIEVWHWMTDRHEAFATLARQYEEQTGIKIKLELFAPSDTYTQKITAAAQANVLPDLYGILDKKSIVGAFIKAGLVADLTADFEANNAAWEKAMYPKALDVMRFSAGNIDEVKPGIYGAPLDVTNIQMVYNKELLKKAGITRVPATFDDFLAAIDALKRVGVAPFVSGFGEMWIVDCFASNYAFNIMGQDKVMATFRGEVKYTDPDWVKVLTIFKTLADRGAFIDGIVTKGNKYAEQDFALGRAAFAFNGSWCVNVYRDMNPDLDYGVASLPAMDQSRPVRSWGGAGSSLVVNGNSSNKDKAIAFLKWLTAKEQQAYFAETTNNLPANRDAGTAISPVLAEFSRLVEHTTHPSIWPLNEDPLVIEAFDKGIQAIIIGDKTPVEIAEQVQSVKERQMKKAAK
jgi:ABC-type glycerol-3-phosphate transport system substrate-binding protein